MRHRGVRRLSRLPAVDRFQSRVPCPSRRGFHCQSMFSRPLMIGPPPSEFGLCGRRRAPADRPACSRRRNLGGRRPGFSRFAHRRIGQSFRPTAGVELANDLREEFRGVLCAEAAQSACRNGNFLRPGHAPGILHGRHLRGLEPPPCPPIPPPVSLDPCRRPYLLRQRSGRLGAEQVDLVRRRGPASPARGRPLYGTYCSSVLLVLLAK